MEIIRLSEGCDLLFSEWDESGTGKGWYVQDYENSRVSESYCSAAETIEAFNSNKIKWEEAL